MARTSLPISAAPSTARPRGRWVLLKPGALSCDTMGERLHLCEHTFNLLMAMEVCQELADPDVSPLTATWVLVLRPFSILPWGVSM